MYSDDMRGEGERVLLEEGWHTFRVTDIKAQTSKSGNEMFKITLEQPDTGAMEDVYAVRTKGKRWLLKQFLTACGIEEDKNGAYNWCEEDVLGASVEGKNVPEPNEYINKAGETIKEMRNKINGFKKAMVKATV